MSNILALKPYIEKIVEHCKSLSKSDLIDLLCQRAQEVSAKEREAFLKKLNIELKNTNESSSKINDADEILLSVNGIVEEIIERQESIEEGSYYEYDNEFEDYYDDDCPDGISEEQKETLEELFSNADQLFLSGNLEGAKNIYINLISLFGHVNSEINLSYEIYHTDVNINWRETLSRYCRSVYETSPLEERVKQMLVSMEVSHPMHVDSYDTSSELYPALQDIVDAKIGDIARWDDFLKKFQKELMQKKGNRAFLLYLESINLLGGLKDVAQEVCKKKIPIGYLYWLDQLEANKSWHELAKASKESLQNMPFDSFRAYAAGKLSLSGEKLEDNVLVLQGKRELFFSVPGEHNCISLLKESVKQNMRDAELKNILDFLQVKRCEKPWTNKNHFVLKIKLLLMQGNLKEAYSQIDKKAAVGWSYTKQATGVVYATILAALIKGNSSAVIIYELLKNYTGSDYTDRDFICDEIRQNLSKITIVKSQKEEWFQFVRELATSRIDYIVSSKHRKAYNRAAETMGGYMECLILNNHRKKAFEFLDWNRNQKYSRFSAFRAEVDRVLHNSILFNPL